MLPEFQRHGIGSQLVPEGLDACRGLGHRIVVVLGHPDYYPRFGFDTAPRLGVRSPFPAQDEAFMVLTLVPGARGGVSGMAPFPHASVICSFAPQSVHPRRPDLERVAQA